MAILGVKNVVFWTFSKLFWSCLVSVWALFLVLNGKFYVYFQPFIILFATHTCYSPLGSREALINVDKASPGQLVLFFTPTLSPHSTPKILIQVYQIGISFTKYCQKTTKPRTRAPERLWRLIIERCVSNSNSHLAK